LLTEPQEGGAAAARGRGAPSDARTPALSVVVPVFDEEDSVEPLAGEIAAVMRGMGEPYEVVFVDDGSADRTAERLAALAAADAHVRVLALDGNFGEAAALSAGFHAARGNVVVTLDGDGQNDPADIPRLVEVLRGRGLAAVSGRREQRQEDYWLRVLPSRLANELIVRVTGIPVHDCGCGLKAYRREVVAGVHLPRGMNRFLPAILGVRAEQVAEVPTRDRPRGAGRSHYGLSRTLVVLRDLAALRWLARDARGAHLRFAFAAAAAGAAGMVAFETSPALGVLCDAMAAGFALVWWNARRFCRAQEEGVYRLEREISHHAGTLPAESP